MNGYLDLVLALIIEISAPVRGEPLPVSDGTMASMQYNNSGKGSSFRPRGWMDSMADKTQTEVRYVLSGLS